MILSWEIDSSFSLPMHKALNVRIRCKIEGYVFFMVRWSIVTSACLQWPILMRGMRPNSVSWEKSLKKRIIKLDNRHMEDCVREVNGGSFFLPERSIMFGDSFLSGSYPVIFLSSFAADSTTYLILFFSWLISIRHQTEAQIGRGEKRRWIILFCINMVGRLIALSRLENVSRGQRSRGERR